ncbi:uncharacterized protein LOC125241700 isoform X2 [Leguminivora glycinivorella]|uniref:uncharacterized protein LOC125241700 isoform X2 n=1 Tax=Leguminivora glycinivorella TaxID=1035111 RepID=UPI00200F754F|nr:uncharacterized protein LOC125241700 isoform X2 [Leguminivora glycinivorella]
MEKVTEPVKIPFEEALDRAGFGLYSYINTFLSGLSIISMACVVYGSTLTVGASACELQTTGAQQGLLVAAPVIGLILGAPLWGYLGDTRGRRRMLLLALLSSALVNAVSGLSVNWVMMMSLQFIASLLGSADYTLAMTLLSESVPMAKRNTAVLMVNCMMMVAQGTMAVIAIPIAPLTYSYHLPALDIYWNSWRTLVVAYSLPSILCAICYYFMQDSPKLTLVKGDEQRTLQILKTIHRVNFGRSAVLDVKAVSSEGLISSAGSKKDQIVPLFQAPLLKNTIIVSCLYMFQLSGSFLAWLPTIANRVIRMYETGEVNNMNLCGILNADIEMVVDPEATPCAMNTLSLLIVLGVGVLQCILNLLITLVSDCEPCWPPQHCHDPHCFSGRLWDPCQRGTQHLGDLCPVRSLPLGLCGHGTVYCYCCGPVSNTFESNGDSSNNDGWQRHLLRLHPACQLSGLHAVRARILSLSFNLCFDSHHCIIPA